ncbi:hypothetical protein RHGRI_016787 [Rhododendron griersonianum]|uniref:Uncharacterized protein n=1 Tax=Rhododendron griersonianum TaxID=479676 RepID=A0AAV6JVE3_9ERIC|nr:hypothetical protein RHGRI_016787 [Rhododendron griersonianum]
MPVEIPWKLLPNKVKIVGMLLSQDHESPTIKRQWTGPHCHEHLDATSMRAPAVTTSSGREMAKASKSHRHGETGYQSRTTNSQPLQIINHCPGLEKSNREKTLARINQLEKAPPKGEIFQCWVGTTSLGRRAETTKKKPPTTSLLQPKKQSDTDGKRLG